MDLRALAMTLLGGLFGLRILPDYSQNGTMDRRESEGVVIVTHAHPLLVPADTDYALGSRASDLWVVQAACTDPGGRPLGLPLLAAVHVVRDQLVVLAADAYQRLARC